MVIAFDTRTGNVKKFVDKLGLRSVQLTKGLKIDEPYVLITYTTGFGEVPELTKDFLQNNAENLKGVAASGNRNWGLMYGKAADIISEHFGVAMLHKFQLSGLEKDVEKLLEGVKSLVGNSRELATV